MNKKKFVSIITPTLNAEKYLPKFFNALDRQSYPKRLIEVVVADGGSTDNTLQIARKHNARIVKNPYIQGQPGVYVGMKHAKGDLHIVLPGDNIFKEKDAIKKIVEIFNSDDKIYAVFPKHDSSSKDSLFTKYINTFTDPINHFLYGKASNARTFKDIYKTIEHNKLYDIYDFKSFPVKPILGLAQGMTVKKEFVKTWKDIYDDILPIIAMSNKDKKIAYAHSVTLFHHTVRDLRHFIRKQRWATRNIIGRENYGLGSRKKFFTKEQVIKMYLFPIYAFSVIFPFSYSVFMFIKDKRSIWLFHPVITFVSAFSVLYELLKSKLGFGNEVSRL